VPQVGSRRPPLTACGNREGLARSINPVCIAPFCYDARMRQRSKLDVLVAVGLFTLAGLAPAAARSGGTSTDDPWNPAHIGGLPQEIRAGIEHSTRACGASVAAKHLVSRYIEDRGSGERFIALHFDEIRCEHRASICTAAGCLHQVYASKGGPYRLVLSVYAPEIELKHLGNAAAVEVACGPSSRRCSRLLRWNGAHFVPQDN
jgi:hypothetical protein